MSNEVDPTRVLQRMQARLSEALLTIAVLETRIDDLTKELYETQTQAASDKPQTGQDWPHQGDDVG